MLSFIDFLTERLSDYSAKELGLFNSVVRLPDKKPYGFWMDRHGNFIPVFDQMGHEEAALKIIEKGDEPIVDGVFDTLLTKGWCRVVLSKKYTYYETYLGNRLTNPQKKNLDFINEFYDLDGVLEG